ncbi:hypothetical protein, partial [Nocardia salmonicida]|uniref:hypothetical protein n=1 Tax=Nocardia salmonicida TaxID=53431 RepID=UPI0033EA1D1F
GQEHGVSLGISEEREDDEVCSDGIRSGALLMTPTHMFGVHINSKASAPVDGLRKLFPSTEEIPYRHTEEYFAMDFRLTPDAVHVISSGIDPDGWTPVPEDTAAKVDLTSLEITRLDGWAT